jgi:hypothetical protein
MFANANDLQENICFSSVCLHSEKCSGKYSTLCVWSNVKQTHHCQPPQFSTNHHKPTKPHHKFNKNYQIHHQLPQIQSHKRKNKSTNRKKIKQNPQPVQEQIHKISKDQAKPTPTPKSNRRHRRALFFWGGFDRGAAALIWGGGFNRAGRLRSGAAALIWGGFSSPTAPPSTTSSGPDLGR